MNNYCNNDLSFGASFLKSTRVKKLSNKTGKFYYSKVSLVEIDPKDKLDVSALSLAAENWVGDKYLSDVVRGLRSGKKISPDGEHRIYALTTQRSKFDNLDSNKLLGVADTYLSKTDGLNLDLLQVRPTDKYGSKTRSYKQVGKAIINFLKKEHNTKISLFADRNAKKFYEGLGFKKNRGLHYDWSPTNK